MHSVAEPLATRPAANSATPPPVTPPPHPSLQSPAALLSPVQSPVSPMQSPLAQSSTQPLAPLSPQLSLLPLAQPPVQSPLVHSPVKSSTPPPTPLSPPPLLQTSVQSPVPVQTLSVQSPVQSSTSPPLVAQLPPEPLARFPVAVQSPGQLNIQPGVPIPSGPTSAPAGSSDESIQHSAAPTPPPASSAGGSGEPGQHFPGPAFVSCCCWRVRGTRPASSAPVSGFHIAACSAPVILAGEDPASASSPSFSSPGPAVVTPPSKVRPAPRHRRPLSGPLAGRHHRRGRPPDRLRLSRHRCRPHGRPPELFLRRCRPHGRPPELFLRRCCFPHGRPPDQLCHLCHPPGRPPDRLTYEFLCRRLPGRPPELTCVWAAFLGSGVSCELLLFSVPSPPSRTPAARPGLFSVWFCVFGLSGASP
ncbi:mitochondrial ribonuclease P protein 3 [Sarotherodon galilaeus]